MIKKILTIMCAVLFVVFDCGCVNETALRKIIKDIECHNQNYVEINLKDSDILVTELNEKGVDVYASDEYDIGVLIEIKEKKAPVVLNGANIASYDNIDQVLLERRKEIKEYYQSYNEFVVGILGLSRYDYCISFYSPYAEVIFNDVGEYMDFESDLLSSLQDNKNIISSVSSCIIYRKLEDEVAINNSGYSNNYLLGQAFEDIEITNALYTGQGIKIGIIESGIPIDTINLKNDRYTFLHNTTTNHALVVSSIIGGNSGIAEDVYFYFASSTSFLDNSNILINSYGVNIINMSFGSVFYGKYTNQDSCIDAIVSRTGCTIVTSAGNQSDKVENPYYITAPGCAMNAITVGSIDSNKNLSAFSSWLVSDSFLSKPDVVAPGGRLWNIPNVWNEFNGHSGTSYAAPMVVGVIALLMEEFPVLKADPALVKSVLHLGAEKLPAQMNNFDQYAGFGLVNYQNMRDCLLKAKYYDFSIDTDVLEGDVISSHFITLSYLSEIKINANIIVNSDCQTSNGTAVEPTYTDYIIKIYNQRTSECVAMSTIDSSVDYLTFVNEDQENSSFRVDVVAAEDSVDNVMEKGAIAYKIICDTHSYGNFLYYDSYSHRKYCSCGTYVSGGHYVNREDIVDNRYVKCLGCKRLLDLYKDLANSTMSTITQVSANGSYILPNGIIVLSPEDIQAYIDDVLVFYHPDVLVSMS